MRDALDTARNNSHNVALDRRKTLPDRSQTREKAAGDEDVQAQTHHPDRKDLRQLAQRTCSMLTQSGVEHWLDFGSLLGLMREGNILEGDTDVDISVIDTPENVEKLEASRAPLADMGIFLKKELTWNAYRAASSLGYVHLYLTQLVNHTYQGAIGDGSEISSDLIGKPTLFDWQGSQVAIPQHTHAFLVARYGDDYMDPDAFYANKSFLGRCPSWTASSPSPSPSPSATPNQVRGQPAAPRGDHLASLPCTHRHGRSHHRPRQLWRGQAAARGGARQVVRGRGLPR